MDILSVRPGGVCVLALRIDICMLSISYLIPQSCGRCLDWCLRIVYPLSSVFILNIKSNLNTKLAYEILTKSVNI